MSPSTNADLAFLANCVHSSGYAPKDAKITPVPIGHSCSPDLTRSQGPPEDARIDEESASVCSLDVNPHAHGAFRKKISRYPGCSLALPILGQPFHIVPP